MSNSDDPISRTAETLPAPAEAPSTRRHKRIDIVPEHQVRLEGVERFIRVARAAARTGSWTQAVNAARCALQFDPQDRQALALLREYTEAFERATASRHSSYAQSLEESGEFLLASRSYERAARGANTAELFRAAAECLLRADQEHERAIDLARRAVSLDEASTSCRSTLARGYERAGYDARAKCEYRQLQKLSGQPKSSD